MIVEKAGILCNRRIIKYLSARSLNGNTIYCQESKREREKQKEFENRRKNSEPENHEHIPTHLNCGCGVLGGNTWGETREYPENPAI